MKIGPKVGLLVGGLVATQAFALASSSDLLFSANTEFSKIVSKQSEDLEAVSSLRLKQSEQQRAFAELALYGAGRPGDEPREASTRYARFYDSYQAIEGRVQTVTAQAADLNNPRLVKDVQQFDAIHKDISKLQKSRVQNIQKGTYKPKVDLALLQKSSQAAGILDSAFTLADKESAAAVTAQVDENRRRVIQLISLSAVLLAISLGFAAWMTRRIVRPIRQLTRSAQHVAATQLPETVDSIRRQSGDIEAPELPALTSGTSGDELETLATALNEMQTSAVSLAVETRRGEIASAETLVNLGRRNQSLLNRTLSYVGELERDERDPKTLANLFRLDHLTTRIRRNAESMLVLAGAEQARTQTKPVPVGNIVRGALSEIEDYTRVRVSQLPEIAVHGPHAADVSHLLAELLENATRFSPGDDVVTVEGRQLVNAYRMIILDRGLGMTEEELEVANTMIATAEESRASTKVLGLHIVGRLAARRGVSVTLKAGDIGGTVAVIDLPGSILVDLRQAAGKDPVEDDLPEVTESVVAVETLVNDPDSRPSITDPAISVVKVTEVGVDEMDPAPARHEPVPAQAGTAPEEKLEVMAQAVDTPPEDAPAMPKPRADRARATRRVRGAQLPDLGDNDTPEIGSRDAKHVGKQLAGLQSSVARARREASDNDTQPSNASGE